MSYDINNRRTRDPSALVSKSSSPIKQQWEVKRNYELLFSESESFEVHGNYVDVEYAKNTTLRDSYGAKDYTQYFENSLPSRNLQHHFKVGNFSRGTDYYSQVNSTSVKHKTSTGITKTVDEYYVATTQDCNVNGAAKLGYALPEHQTRAGASKPNSEELLLISHEQKMGACLTSEFEALGVCDNVRYDKGDTNESWKSLSWDMPFEAHQSELISSSSSSSHPRSSRPRLSSESLADDHQAVEALEAAPQQQAHDQPDMAPSSDKLQKMSHKSMSSLSSSNGDGSRNVGVALSSLPRITVSAPSAPPVVTGSPHHTVMVRVSGRAATQEQKQNVPPRPYPAVFRDVWDSHHVRMPCSPASFHVVDTLENTTSPRWTAIKQALSNPMRSVEEMERAVLYYNKRYSNRWHFKGLRKLIHEDFTEMERDHFLDVTLPAMCTLALRLPDLVTQPPPLLKAHYGHSITLSQLQISCLLANAFFCTFPRRNATGAETEYALYPDINFNRLLSNKLPRAIEKIKCIINYFRRVTTKEPTGVVTVVRQQVDNTDAVTWQQCSSQFTRLHCDDRGYIDDATGLLQVDFANRFLGGGVLGLGCVQEEIRFVICPELLITRLFTESLDKTEAIIVIGVEQYNKSTGYSDTFKFDGNHQDTTDSDAYGRKLSQLVAIDAVRFSRRAQLQYQETLIIRELNKAYAGFCPLDGSEGRPVAVATGNWGCGAFKGDPKLKALIQLSVCGYAERDVAYYTFKDSHLRNNIVDMHQFLLQNNITVGTLVQCLCQYGQLEREVDGSDLFNYVYHSLSSKVSSPDSSPGNSPRPSGAGHGAGSGGGGGGGGTTQQDQTQKYKQNQHRDDSNQQHSRENRGNQQRSHINKEQHHQRSREEGKQNGRSQKWRPEHKQQNKQQMTSKQNQQQVQQQQNTVNRKSGANSTSDDWRAQSRNMNNGFSGSKKQVKRPNNNKITKYFSSVTKQAGNEPNRNNNNSRSNSCQKSDRNNLTEDEIVAHIVNYDEHHNASAAGATASAAGANASAGDASTGGVSDASSAGGFSYSAMARKKPNDKND